MHCKPHIMGTPESSSKQSKHECSCSQCPLTSLTQETGQTNVNKFCTSCIFCPLAEAKLSNMHNKTHNLHQIILYCPMPHDWPTERCLRTCAEKHTNGHSVKPFASCGICLLQMFTQHCASNPAADKQEFGQSPQHATVHVVCDATLLTSCVQAVLSVFCVTKKTSSTIADDWRSCCETTHATLAMQTMQQLHLGKHKALSRPHLGCNGAATKPICYSSDKP